MKKKYKNDARDIFDDGTPCLSHSFDVSVGVKHILSQRLIEIKERYQTDNSEHSEKTEGVNESGTS